MGKGMSWASSIGVGAGLMYLLDPEHGKGRRAQVRHQTGRILRRAGGALGTAGRHLRNRAQGAAARATPRIGQEPVSDATLLARVRSRLGRVVSHPRAVTVTAYEGRVVLSGSILKNEMESLLLEAASVPGVAAVEDQLDIHATAESVPALQGSGRTRCSERRSGEWPPAARLLVGAAGGLLTVYGRRRGGALGTAMGMAGVGLMTRGAAAASVFPAKPAMDAAEQQEAPTAEKQRNAPLEDASRGGGSKWEQSIMTVTHYADTNPEKDLLLSGAGEEEDLGMVPDTNPVHA